MSVLPVEFLLFFSALLCFVVSNNTASRCSQNCMMARVVTGNATNNGSFYTAFCLSRIGARHRDENHCATKKFVHDGLQVFHFDDNSRA